jgi:hypothetical protein
MVTFARSLVSASQMKPIELDDPEMEDSKDLNSSQYLLSPIMEYPPSVRLSVETESTYIARAKHTLESTAEEPIDVLKRQGTIGKISLNQKS